MAGNLLNGDVSNEVFESSSCTQINCVKLRHTWTIQNFSMFTSKSYEKLISPEFSSEVNSDTPKWRLWLFPNGDIKGNPLYVGLYLQLVTSKMDQIQTKYRLGIVNAKGQDINFLHSSNLMKSGSLGGHERFVQRKFLFNEENDLLPNDELTIYCEITAAVGMKNITQSGGEKELNDDGVKFQHDFKENSNTEVQMTDEDEQDLYEMLKYAYTGKIDNSKKFDSFFISFVTSFPVSKIKRICEQDLIASLSLKNVGKFFNLSDQLGATDLKIQIKKFIVANASALGDTPEFIAMFLAYPNLGLEAFRALSGKFAID